MLRHYELMPEYMHRFGSEENPLICVELAFTEIPISAFIHNCVLNYEIRNNTLRLNNIVTDDI